MNVLAIDPGNIESAYVIMDVDTYKPVEFGKVGNKDLLSILTAYSLIPRFPIKGFVIEMIGHYGTGMPAGKTVFDTCIWIGRFTQLIESESKDIVEYMLRATVKTHLCGSPRSKDSNIIQALKDRFGDKGTKASPGFFYGFKADCWQSFALGATYIDKMKENL